MAPQHGLFEVENLDGQRLKRGEQGASHPGPVVPGDGDQEGAGLGGGGVGHAAQVNRCARRARR